MESELGEVLADEGDHAGIVGPGAHFAEPHRVVADEELHPEDAAAAQFARHLRRDPLAFRERRVGHGLRLPGLPIVAALLAVADGRAEGDAIPVTHRQQRDLVVEVDKTLHDDLFRPAPGPFPGDPPGCHCLRCRAHGGLPLAGRTHHRLDHARGADGPDRIAVFVLGRRKTVGGSGDAQGLGRQATDALAVHGQPGCPRRGNDPPALAFQVDKRRRGDGLDFRHDQMRLLRLDDAAQLTAVEHVDHVAAVGDLHPRRVGIAVHGDHLDAQALQLDHHFLAELAGAERHHPGGARRQRRADAGHGRFIGLRPLW